MARYHHSRRSAMSREVERIVKAAGRLDEFNAVGDFHLRVENPGWMALVIEAHARMENTPGRGERRVSVTHYYEENGDLVPDPDVVIDEFGNPLEMTMATGQYTPCIWHSPEHDGWLENKRCTASVNEFNGMWARNLKEQGYADAAAAICG
jgi:hypothetical protein